MLIFGSVTNDLKNLVIKLENRVSQLEKGGAKPAPAVAAVPAKPAAAPTDDGEDDVDLFGSDSEDEEAKAEKVKWSVQCAIN